MRAKEYSAAQVAAWILARQAEPISLFKLQALLYYGQAWSLAMLAQPLFLDEMEAWSRGPVAVSVWHQGGANSEAMVTADAFSSPAALDEALVSLLDGVLQAYVPLTDGLLEEMLHQDPAWLEARGELAPEARCTTPVNWKTMMQHYRALHSVDKEP